jgi:hypothetical protein
LTDTVRYHILLSMEYQPVSDETTRAEEAALRWLTQRLCFEAWLEGAREPTPEPDRRVPAAA